MEDSNPVEQGTEPISSSNSEVSSAESDVEEKSENVSQSNVNNRGVSSDSDGEGDREGEEAEVIPQRASGIGETPVSPESTQTSSDEGEELDYETGDNVGYSIRTNTEAPLDHVSNMESVSDDEESIGEDNFSSNEKDKQIRPPSPPSSEDIESSRKQFENENLSILRQIEPEQVGDSSESEFNSEDEEDKEENKTKTVESEEETDTEENATRNILDRRKIESGEVINVREVGEVEDVQTKPEVLSVSDKAEISDEETKKDVPQADGSGTVFRDTEEVSDDEDGVIEDEEQDGIEGDDGIVEEEDGVIEDEDSVVKDEDGVVEEEDGVIEDEDSVVEEEDGVMEGEDGVVEEEDGVVEDEDGLIEEEDGVIEEEDGVIEDEDCVIKDEEDVEEDVVATKQSQEKSLKRGMSQSSVPAFDVHHHGDELDFEEDVEDTSGMHETEREVETGARENGDVGEVSEMAEQKKEQREDKTKEEGEEEEEEGEEGEVNDDDDDDNSDGEAGEIEDDDDAEEGEVKDPYESPRRHMARATCRFFIKGQCTWGNNCRFLHPGINDRGNYSLIDFKDIQEKTARLLNIKPPTPIVEEKPPDYEEPLFPEPYPDPYPQEHFPPPPEEPRKESVWERGIKQAKEIRKKAAIRKEHGVPDERYVHVVEEIYEDFNMEAEFQPDFEKPSREYYGYPVEQPAPEYHPREPKRYQPEKPREPREFHPRYNQRPTRPSNFFNQRHYDRPAPQKDEFGRDYSKRQELTRPSRPQQKEDIPTRFSPPKPTRVVKEDKPKVLTESKPADAWQDPWARTRSPKPKPKAVRKRVGSHSSDSSVSSRSLSRSASGSRSRSRSFSSRSSRSSSGSSFSSRSRSASPTPQRKALVKPAGSVPKSGLPASGERKVPLVKKPVTPMGRIPKKNAAGPPTASGPPSGPKRPPPNVNAVPARQLQKAAELMTIKHIGMDIQQKKKQLRKRTQTDSSTSSRSRSRGRSSSASSHSSVSSRSSADSDNMYADLASPVSSASSSGKPHRSRKIKGDIKPRPKPGSGAPVHAAKRNIRDKRQPHASAPKTKPITVPSMEAFATPPEKPRRSSRPAPLKSPVKAAPPEPKFKSTSAPAQMKSSHPVRHSAHKEIKLTLLSKPGADGKKKYEVLGDGASKKVKPVAPVKPVTKAMVDRERMAKQAQHPTKKSIPSAAISPSVKSASLKHSMAERKRPPSPFKQREQPPAKMSHKAPAGGAPGAKTKEVASSRKATVSRREEILKQLKAVEDMIARKKAKMKSS